MSEVSYSDNRYEVISRAKEHLLKATNIQDSKEEMEVLDNFLFRCWQMGWLKQYDGKHSIEYYLKSWYNMNKSLYPELIIKYEESDYGWNIVFNVDESRLTTDSFNLILLDFEDRLSELFSDKVIFTCNEENFKLSDKAITIK